MSKQAIGVIDSGVGGLTVLKEALKQLPNESFYYVGDTARCPYGPRPSEEVKAFTREMADYLLDRQIKMLVIACNTATAAALVDLQRELPIPVVGVIDSGSLAAVEATKINQIGIIGTEGTIKSESYARAIEKERKEVELYSLACPTFVTLVETNQYTGEKAKRMVEEVLSPLKQKELDTLILGCTHFPILKPLIQEVMGPDVTLVDSGVETVKKVKKILDEKQLNNTDRQIEPETVFYTTGAVQPFRELASQWLGKEDLTIQSIELGGKE